MPAVQRVEVTTTTLDQLSPSDLRPSVPMPPGIRVDLAHAASPAFVRWLYVTVGGPWNWIDRLTWPRSQWATELAQPGSEVWVAYADGVPAGYFQLSASPNLPRGGTACEITYFGLQVEAIGHGIGGPLLTLAIERAWSLADRHDLAAVTRVWVHTCDLDAPAALANYRARGMRITDTKVTQEVLPLEAPDVWLALGGPPEPPR